jgi:hypothetical protein
MLIGMENVATVGIKKPGDRGDNALAIAAVD